MTFDKEKWRADALACPGYTESILALLERAYAEGRADENEAIAKEFDAKVMVIESNFTAHRTECDMKAAATFVRTLAAARGTP